MISKQSFLSGTRGNITRAIWKGNRLQNHLDWSGSGTRRLISTDEPLYWTDPRWGGSSSRAGPLTYLRTRPRSTRPQSWSLLALHPKAPHPQQRPPESLNAGSTTNIAAACATRISWNFESIELATSSVKARFISLSSKPYSSSVFECFWRFIPFLNFSYLGFKYGQKTTNKCPALQIV